MAPQHISGGIEYERARLDRAERGFWRGIWDSVPLEIAAEHGIELRDFGPVQATVATALPDRGMLNLVLGATELGAVADGHLAAAANWAQSRGVQSCVPVTPDLPETNPAEAWLTANGFAPGYAWMKFVRDPHPPRFKVPQDVEVVELTAPGPEPFGMIAATGFGLPAWGSTFFANLPGREGWRCYVGRVDGEAQACAAMHVHNGVAELGIAATLEPARAAVASSPSCAAASSMRSMSAATPSSSRPASVSPPAPPPATGTSSGPASRRRTCGRTGRTRTPDRPSTSRVSNASMPTR
jgi:hypothetical protein